MSGELVEEMVSISKALGEVKRINGWELPVKIHGKVFDYRPRNVSTLTVADAIKAGRGTFVRLEPGDGTRYDFLIMGLRGHTSLLPSYGVSTGGFVYVSQVNLQRESAFMQVSDYFAANWYADEFTQWNDFTRLAICWFVGALSHQYFPSGV